MTPRGTNLGRGISPSYALGQGILKNFTKVFFSPPLFTQKKCGCGKGGGKKRKNFFNFFFINV
jgi:hypothetical protein